MVSWGVRSGVEGWGWEVGEATERERQKSAMRE